MKTGGTGQKEGVGVGDLLPSQYFRISKGVFVPILGDDYVRVSGAFVWPFDGMGGMLDFRGFVYRQDSVARRGHG